MIPDVKRFVKEGSKMEIENEVAEREGFEPSRAIKTLRALQARALDQAMRPLRSARDYIIRVRFGQIALNDGSCYTATRYSCREDDAFPT